MLGVDQRLIEDLQELLTLELARIVEDQDGGRAAARGAAPLDPRARMSDALDGRAAPRLAPDQPVAEPDAAGQLVHDLPGGEHRAVALDPPAVPASARGQGQIAGRVDVGGAAAVRGRAADAGRSCCTTLPARDEAIAILDLSPGASREDLEGPHLLDLEQPTRRTAGRGLGVGSAKK